MENYDHFMKLCRVLGEQAAAKGNQPVGTIITSEDVIISEAEEAATSKKDITCHSEIEAIRLAVQKLKSTDLSQCVLITTHEPCIMCAYAIRFHKIKKVVYQNKVKWLGCVTSSMPLLTSIEVPPHWSAPPVIIHWVDEE